MKLSVPFFPQPGEYNCVSACIKMILRYHGQEIPFKKIAAGCKIPKRGGGSLETAGMFLAELGFTPTLTVTPRAYKKLKSFAGNKPRKVNFTQAFSLIRLALRKRKPVVVSFVAVPPPGLKVSLRDSLHAVVVIGMDRKKVVLLDPGKTRKKQPIRLTRAEFEKYWQLADWQLLYL